MACSRCGKGSNRPTVPPASGGIRPGTVPTSGRLPQSGPVRPTDAVKDAINRLRYTPGK